MALPRGVTVSAPLTLAELHPDHEKDISKKNKKKSRGLDIVVPTFEGHVYILNKPETGTACAQRIDVGEHIAAPVLLHDLDHNGYLDLVVSTVHGQVYAIETSTRSVPSQPLMIVMNDMSAQGLGKEHLDKFPESSTEHVRSRLSGRDRHFQ